VIEPGVVRTELLDHVGDSLRDAAQRLVDGVEPLEPDDVADAIAYVVSRKRRIAVNEVLLRAADQTW
jgi:NADP-dependent 3-hydroxy acid dehydrogenase YdfG